MTVAWPSDQPELVLYSLTRCTANRIEWLLREFHLNYQLNVGDPGKFHGRRFSDLAPVLLIATSHREKCVCGLEEIIHYVLLHFDATHRRTRGGENRGPESRPVSETELTLSEPKSDTRNQTLRALELFIYD